MSHITKVHLTMALGNCHLSLYLQQEEILKELQMVKNTDKSRSFDIFQIMTSRIQVTAKHHHYMSPNNCKKRLYLLKTGRKVWLRVYLKCLKRVAGIFPGSTAR